MLLYEVISDACFIQSVLQIVTLLEGVIKQDHLSSEFRTTKELLGSSTSFGNAVYDSAYTGSVPVLAWIPQTTAAVAVRLLELDASISYIHQEKSELQIDKKDLGESRVSPLAPPALFCFLHLFFPLFFPCYIGNKGKMYFPFQCQFKNAKPIHECSCILYTFF